MSTIYVFDDELSALATPATGDKILVSDVSAGTKKAVTLANVTGTLVTGANNTWTGTNAFNGSTTTIGNSSADTLGFYGATAIARPASASQTAITVGATTTAHKTLTIALRKALKDLGLIKGAA